MNGKTLLVLGASRYQLPAIKYAISQGIRVVVTDNIAHNPGHKIADKSYLIDTTDQVAVLKLAKKENVDAAIAPCTDVAVSTAAYVNNQLGISSVSVAGAQTLTSKIEFREFQMEHNLPYPKFEQVTDVELMAKRFDFSRKWIIKPDQSSGSKGIFIIQNKKQLLARYPESSVMSLNGKVTVEQVIEGCHGTVEGLVKDGKIQKIFFLDRQTAAPPYVCTVGHRTPSKFHEAIKSKINSEIQKLLSLLAVDNTVFDVDFIWDGEQVFILEASPRLGGNSITELLALAYGINFLELAVSTVFSQTCDCQSAETAKPTAVILLGVDHNGVLSVDQQIANHLKSVAWVVSMQLHAQDGDPVEAFTNGRHCLMTLFISAASYEELVERETYVRGLKMLRSIQ